MKQIERKATQTPPKSVGRVVAFGLKAFDSMFGDNEPAFAGAHGQVREPWVFRGKNLPSTALGIQFDPGDERPYPLRIHLGGPQQEIKPDLDARTAQIKNIMVCVGSDEDRSMGLKRTRELENLLRQEENPLLAAALVMGIVVAGKLENEDGFGSLKGIQKVTEKLHANFEKSRQKWDEQRFGPFGEAVRAFGETLGKALNEYHQLNAEQVRAQVTQMAQDVYDRWTRFIPKPRPIHQPENNTKNI